MSSRVDRALRDSDPTILAVAGLTLLALVARLVLLGDRIAHFDEARVAYWSLEYVETGAFHYRFIIHGPLVQHVNRWLFPLLGATDFTMRLFVAVVGGLLPLAALLFRGRLRDDETVALAALLALNPVLLYYSRFFRSTILVAGFMLVALGFGIRALDTARPRPLYVAAVFAGLGLASKENAVVYVLCWLGAGALLLDFSLMAPVGDERGSDLVRRRIRAVRETLADPAGKRRVRYWAGHVAGALGLGLLVAFFLYAPRAPGSAVGFWEGVFNPARFPALVDATWTDFRVGMEYWFGGASDPGCNKDTLIAGYACYLERFLAVMATYAPALSLFAVLGFVADRYGSARPRPLVMLAGYWGFVSVLGYPLGTDIFGAWIVVNALVPLAIPAAVGLAMLVNWGRDALAADDQTGAVLTGLVLLLVVGQVATAGVSGVYLQPQSDSNELVQFAQPSEDMRPVLKDLRAGAPEHQGLDVLFYGSEVAVPPDEAGGLAPGCSKWVKTLPLHWYIRAADATADCAVNETRLESTIEEQGEPMIVIAHADQAATVRQHLDGYVSRTYEIRTPGRPIVFFVKEEYATETSKAESGG